MSEIPEWIKEIEELEKRATPAGKWVVEPAWKTQYGVRKIEDAEEFDLVSEQNELVEDGGFIKGEMPIHSVFYESWGLSKDNAEFIASSKNNIPKLISALRCAMEALEFYKQRSVEVRDIDSERMLKVSDGTEARIALEKIKKGEFE